MGLVPREPVKLVCPKCRCSRKASSQGNKSSWSVSSVHVPEKPRSKETSRSIPSVDAPEEPCPKGTSQVGLSRVSMLQKGLVPREPVKLVYPKFWCSRRALSQGNQSSWSIASVDAPEELCPKGTSRSVLSIGAPEEPRPKGTGQVGLSQVSMLQKSLVPREQVGVSQVSMLQKGLVPREAVK